MTCSLLQREILSRHISKTRKAARLKFCIRQAFMAIMIRARFYFNRLMEILIFGIREPRGPGEWLKRPGLVGLKFGLKYTENQTNFKAVLCILKWKITEVSGGFALWSRPTEDPVLDPVGGLASIHQLHRLKGGRNYQRRREKAEKFAGRREIKSMATSGTALRLRGYKWDLLTGLTHKFTERKQCWIPVRGSLKRRFSHGISDQGQAHPRQGQNFILRTAQWEYGKREKGVFKKWKIINLNTLRDGTSGLCLTLSGLAFFVVRQARGVRGPGCQKSRYHQPIEMKLCMSQYSHESMPDAKFESGIFSSFGDMTSQNFPLKRGTSHKIRIFTPGKWI